jgi:hypothetical protein
MSNPLLLASIVAPAVSALVGLVAVAVAWGRGYRAGVADVELEALRAAETARADLGNGLDVEAFVSSADVVL